MPLRYPLGTLVAPLVPAERSVRDVSEKNASGQVGQNVGPMKDPTYGGSFPGAQGMCSGVNQTGPDDALRRLKTYPTKPESQHGFLE